MNSKWKPNNKKKPCQYCNLWRGRGNLVCNSCGRKLIKKEV